MRAPRTVVRNAQSIYQVCGFIGLLSSKSNCNCAGALMDKSKKPISNYFLPREAELVGH